MKILFLTIADKTTASSRVRVYAYLPYLLQAGIRSSVLHYTPFWQSRKILSMHKQNIVEKLISKAYSMLIMLFLFMRAPFFDIIYIQKVALSKFFLAVLKALNARIIFDFDDAIYLHRDICHILRSSAAVVVSNSYLKRFVSKFNNHVYELISPVEVDGQAPVKRNGTVRLGWIGSPETTVYLCRLIPVLEGLKREFTDLDIEFMGAAMNNDLAALGVKIRDWSIREQKGYLDKIDIGIMPLTDDEPSRAKGGYKLLQYMSAGTACAASPVGINKELVQDGKNGFLADTPEEWKEKLSLLIGDASLRRRMGREGQKQAQKLYSYRVCAPQLIKILRSVYVHR